jgi:aerobic-type carbon monoxide dehydrogenase small subunit (CoxS/CutS family)
MATTVTINGAARTIDVDDDTPLLWVIRDVLGMTGTKFGCGRALCGVCTVHVDGVATRSCVLRSAHQRRKRQIGRNDRGAWRDTGRKTTAGFLDQT